MSPKIHNQLEICLIHLYTEFTLIYRFYVSGSKKQLAKSLKNTLRLYSSFSSEVVYVLLEYMVNALDSSNFEHLEDSETDNKQTIFDDWKSVVLKLSRKEPEFLLTLVQAVLEKIESHEAVDCEIGKIIF